MTVPDIRISNPNVLTGFVRDLSIGLGLSVITLTLFFTVVNPSILPALLFIAMPLTILLLSLLLLMSAVCDKLHATITQ